MSYMNLLVDKHFCLILSILLVLVFVYIAASTWCGMNVVEGFKFNRGKKKKKLSGKKAAAAADRKMRENNTTFQDELKDIVNKIGMPSKSCLGGCPIKYRTGRVILSSEGGRIFGNNKILLSSGNRLKIGTANNDKYPQDFVFFPVDSKNSDYVSYGDRVKIRNSSNNEMNGEYTITDPTNPTSTKIIKHHNSVRMSNDYDVDTSDFKYIGEGGCTNDITRPQSLCDANGDCEAYGQQSNGCWHILKTTAKDDSRKLKRSKYPKNFQKGRTDTWNMVVNPSIPNVDPQSSEFLQLYNDSCNKACGGLIITS